MEQHLALEVEDRERVAAFWSDRSDESFSAVTYWLGHPAVHDRYQRLAVGGKPSPHWVNHCVDHLGQDRGRILTIGCGDGELERHLLLLGAAQAIDALDISPGRVETARRRAAEEGLDRVTYYVSDAEKDPLPGSGYSAVFFDSSLHHMADLESLLPRVSEVLAPGGLVIANEYVGPNRFALSAREEEVLRSVFLLIPERYRRSLRSGDRGALLTEPWIPDPAEVARVDPSEAIRSADIPGALKRYFDIVEHNDAGGTLLHYVLESIVGNFRADDPAGRAMLELLFTIEDTLLATGELRSHFALIIARKRA